MRKLLFVTLVVLSVLPVGCRKAEFEPINVTGSGGAQGDALLDDPDVAPLACGDESKTACTPAACDSICHVQTGSVATGQRCTIYYGTNPSRYDDCQTGDICLTPELGGYSYCFQLCTTAATCISGGACSYRSLSTSGTTQIKVCDPAPVSCSSLAQTCCDPLSNANCDNGTCYLVAPSSTGQDSQTVCDFSSGENTHTQPCTSSHDCAPTLACYFKKATDMTGTCYQVCVPGGLNACNGGACTPYAKQWGVCLE